MHASSNPEPWGIITQQQTEGQSSSVGLVRRSTAHYRAADGGFLGGFFSGLGAWLFLWPQERFKPPRYPRNARHSDLVRIARDMYSAMETMRYDADEES